MQDAYRTAAPHGLPKRTAFELALGLSQRISDTLAIRWDQWGPDGFEIVQSKTATALVIPPTATLAAYLDSIDRRADAIVTGIKGGGDELFQWLSGVPGHPKAGCALGAQ